MAKKMALKTTSTITHGTRKQGAQGSVSHSLGHKPHTSAAMQNSRAGKIVRTAHTPGTGQRTPRPAGATPAVRGTVKASQGVKRPA